MALERVKTKAASLITTMARLPPRATKTTRFDPSATCPPSQGHLGRGSNAFAAAMSTPASQRPQTSYIIVSMRAFSHLLDRLSLTASRTAKLTLVRDFLSQTPDPD